MSSAKGRSNEYSFSASTSQVGATSDILSESQSNFSGNSIWDNIFDEAEFGEDGEYNHDKYVQSSKDCIVVLIDASKEMFEPTEMNEIPFHNAVNTAIALYTDKIISSDSDLIGVCFYGTKDKKNLNEFENIYVLQDLDVPDAHRILELETLISSDEFPLGSNEEEFPFCDALWTCSTLFSNCTVNVGHKRIFLFTNEDNPNAGNQNIRDQSIQRAKDLSELNIDIELFSMNKSSTNPFDPNLFYKYIISYSEDDAHAGHVSFDASSKFEELRAKVRRKEFKKRSLGKLPLSIVNSEVEIGVRLYNLIQECKPAAHVQLDAKTNQRVKTVTKWVCEDTGSVLLSNQMKRSYLYGGEKVLFTNEEIKSIKVIDKTPGVRLIGFKPTDSLKNFYHIRSSSFIYPDESVIKGSTTAFIALLDRMIYMEKIGIARFTPRANTAPRFVALLPQREELDGDGIQITPPGFHIIYLPYADDIRQLTLPKTDKANEEQVLKAKKIVKSLRIKFDSRSFENPSLQKYYSNLQALALERDSVDVTPDFVQPDEDGMEHFKERIMEFRNIIFGDFYDVTAAARKKKRDRDGEDGEESLSQGTTKKIKKEKLDLSGIDFTNENAVKKLTIPELKDFLKANRVHFQSSAKKQELVDKVVEYSKQSIVKKEEEEELE